MGQKRIMTKYWLIRHGETDWNIQRRFQGITEQPLNEVGRRQAAALAPRLKAVLFDAIYASDLGRVQETCKLALNDAVQPVQFDARLREMNFGAWEGLMWDEIREKYPDDFEKWWRNRDYNAHGGDKLSDVVGRVRSFLSNIRQHYQGEEHILIVAHGGTLGILLSLMLGADPMKWWQFRLQNCTLNEILLYPDIAILSRFNDDRHLSTNEQSSGW